MMDQITHDYLRIENKLNEIFDVQGYTVISKDPGFVLGKEGSNSSFELPFEIAARIVDLYGDAEIYWNSSDC